MGSTVPRRWYLMKLFLQTSWVQRRGTCPLPVSSQVLVAPGLWCRAVRGARGASPRGRRQSWQGMFCIAVGVHLQESVVWGLPGELPGGCGQAGDRKGSREDLGHHLVASLTAFPKSLSQGHSIARPRAEETPGLSKRQPSRKKRPLPLAQTRTPSGYCWVGQHCEPEQ